MRRVSSVKIKDNYFVFGPLGFKPQEILFINQKCIYYYFD